MDTRLNLDVQYYDNIPLRLINRKDYPWRKAKRFTVNGTNQNVWIPNKHLLDDGTIKENTNLDYVFLKAEHQKILYYAGIIWKKEKT